MKNLWQIFFELFRISLFVIGGGYSILMVADRRFAKLGWTKEGEFIDHLPVFQMIPGLIATHTAVYIGRKRAGKIGALVGVIAVAIPAVMIFIGVSICYKLFPLGNPWLESAFVGLRAALTGIIAATIAKSWRKSLPDTFAYSLMVASIFAIGYFHVHIALVLVLAMLLGLSTTAPSRSPAPSTPRFNSVSFFPLLLFAQYGALCFGGGFVIVPMYLHDFIGESAPYLQIAENEFGDIMALSQMTPGPVGVNCATFFGYRLAGVPGALISSAMLLLPGSVLVYAALSSLEKFRSSRIVKGVMRGIRPASIALMLVALFTFAKMTVYVDDAFHYWGLILTIIATVITMSKKVNIILLIILCALTGSALRAEVAAKDYPDADTVTLDNREEIEYFADGTFRSVSETWQKALTEKGRRELSSDGLGYSRRYGAAEFVEVAIISPNGATNVLDLAELVKESTDNSSTVANIYDPLDRQIICNIPGVKVGDIVYIKKTRSTFAARCQDQWADISVFEDFSPILRSSLRVKCPKDRPLQSVAIRHPIGNIVHSAVTNDDGSVTMEWCATNSPQAFYEPSMPSPYRQLQHLYISTARNWQEMSKWYWDLCAPHLAKTNAAMIAKVRELEREVGVGGGNEALMKAIFKFVSQEIRYMGLTMEDKSPGYAPHDVDITFDKRYGVCRDKAGLLTAMLRMAGFNAYPVLIMAGSAKMDPDVPSPYFNHAIVAVENEVEKGGEGGRQKYILLDPTAESTRDFLPSYESDCSYLVARPDGEILLTTPTPPADDNLLKINSTAVLDEAGSLMVESEIIFKGLNDNVFRQRFLCAKPTDRRQYFEETVARTFPGAKLLKYEILPTDLQDVSCPLTAKIVAKVPEALLRGNSEIQLITGWLSRNLGVANMLLSNRTALESRRFPLRLSSTAGIEESLRVSLGETLGKAKSIPETLEIEGPYEYRLSAVVTNGEYMLSRKLKINSLEFSPEEYLTLRENIKAVQAAERRSSVFDKNRLADADIEYLLRGMSVDFTGERSWIVTNTVVKKILTYDGKKGNSELEFEFNPLVRQVRVLHASVVGADGRMAMISDKELNELDCDWAAVAPRYPASKKLIVTLPSVEIGSVITTVTETVVTDAPHAFRGRFYLDVIEPTDVLIYRVGKDRRRVDDPERIPNEDSQPAGHRWRKSFVVDRGTFAATCEFLRKAASVESLDLSILDLDLQPRPHESLKAIRDWMAKHVRIAGPSLYELPVAKQLTDPATVVKERYATRLDYIRTLCALMKGAGFKADIVFGSSLRGEDERYPQAYDQALCRVDGMFFGTENEYSPLGTTRFDGCWCIDPMAEKEFVVSAMKPELRNGTDAEIVMRVRPNGAVDYDYVNFLRGETGGWRRYFAEILPEMRSRVYQQYLGSIAQSASATSELVTDTVGYPASMRFSCYIPDLAVVQGDTITLTIPALSFPSCLTGDIRRSPVCIPACSGGIDRRKVVFPEGYVEIEHLPESFTLHDPANPEDVWLEVNVMSEVVNERLEITIEQRMHRYDERVIAEEYYPMLLEWSRRVSSPSSRTITVRR